MRRDNLTIIIPNPHQGDISAGLLQRILRQAGVTRDEWFGE
jgi:predicted RNA binding protein YcfA (HicA-like mRNA interferase family)